MNDQELKNKLTKLLEESEVDTKQLAWNDIEDSFIDLVAAELGKFKLVYGPERTEGCGDFDGAQAVFHFLDHNVYISIEGSYSSDNGMDFNEGLSVVEPVEVTTTVYRAKR